MKKPKSFKPRHRGNSGARKFNGRQEIDNMYDGEWEKYRKNYLQINYRCYACGSPATVVDHLVPHKGDEKLFKKRDNHIPLCAICHNTITSLYDRNYRPGNSIDPKLKWLQGMRAMNDLTFKVKVLPTYP